MVTNPDVFDGDRKLVQLHYYATHPQTFYGDARVSWDTVGMARDRMQKATGVFQIYFTGCCGNVTMGKYNDGNRESREQLATRLLDAMQRSSSADADSIANTVDVASLKPSDIQWDSAPIEFTVREEGTFNPELLKTQLDPDQPFSTRLTAAMFSGFGQRLRDCYIAQATRLRIGNIEVVNLPGEPFVEFQLFGRSPRRTLSPASRATASAACGTMAPTASSPIAAAISKPGHSPARASKKSKRL